MKLNKITKTIRLLINPQKSHDEIYSDALDMFVNRLARGAYNG